MYPANWFNILPNEIVIGIFRDYFNYDEKVNILKDDYFWRYLNTSYAWKEKLKIPLKTLKGASENLLNEIESGYYRYMRKNTKIIFKVLNNTKRGTVTIEQFVHGTKLLGINSNQSKTIKEYVPIERVKSMFYHLKSNYLVFKHDIYTDKWGHFIVDIEPRFLENLGYYILTKAPEYPNVLIYKKHYYFVFIIGNLEYCNMHPFSAETFVFNSELLLLICRIAHSNCNKIIKTKNYIAYKMKPWRNFYRFTMKTTFNYMSNRKMIKLTTKIK